MGSVAWFAHLFFYMVVLIFRTSIVWDKLKVKSKTEDFRPDVMEEFEDQDGNVFNKKT